MKLSVQLLIATICGATMTSATPAFADATQSQAVTGDMGHSSAYTQRGVDADRSVHDYVGYTSKNKPMVRGGLAPATTAVLGGVFGTPDTSSDWGALPSDVAPLSALNDMYSQYETPGYVPSSAGGGGGGGSQGQPANSGFDTTAWVNQMMAFNPAATGIASLPRTGDAYTNFVKNWQGAGPPPIPIFQCSTGFGWMPQAGAGAPIVPGGGIHGQPGAIQWTGSWNPSSLGPGF